MKKSAFQVNRLYGLSGMFPLGFDLEQLNQATWSASLHPQSVSEAAEILTAYSKKRICIFGVDHHSYVDGSFTDSVSISQTAKEIGLNPEVPDIDVIVINTTELPSLLDKLCHYNMSLLDMEYNLNQDQVLDCVLKAIDAQSGKGRIVLDNVSISDIYLKSHDDCYMYVESRRIEHLKDHLRCLLKNYVSSKLKRTISLPPQALVEEYLAIHRSITILDNRTSSIRGALKMPCSSESFSFREPKNYPVTATIFYYERTCQWVLDLTK